MATSAANRAAAARASKTKVVARSSKPPPTVGIFGQGSPLGVNARLGTAAPNPAAAASSPNYATPAAMGAVTPIAAPPVVQDPFLTPTDLANQALELSDVQGYLNNVDLNVGNARVDAQQRLAATDTAEQRNLDSADWNTAARGLAQSSVRDTTKANLSADAAQSRSGTNQSLGLANDYAAGEHQRVDTVVRPAITSKYNELMKKNAQDVTDNTPPPATSTEPQAPIEPLPPATPQVISQQRQPSSITPQQLVQSATPTSWAHGGEYKVVVSGGYVRHVYPDGYSVAVRKA